MSHVFALFVIALLVFVVVLGFMATLAVPQGMNFTVERFGRFTRILRPGLHFIMPVVDSVGAKMNMMETVMDVPTQEVIESDPS